MTPSEFVDDYLACEAEGCNGGWMIRGNLSVWMAAEIMDAEIPDETFERWCDDVEEEFRSLPRPSYQKPWLPEGSECPPTAVRTRRIGMLRRRGYECLASDRWCGEERDDE